MRILKEWTYKHLRVTIMEMNAKTIIKLEDGLLEQTYKLRDDVIQNLGQLDEKMTDAFYDNATKIFEHMKENSRSAFEKTDTFDDEFDVII